MLFVLQPQNPDNREIQEIVNILNKGGVIVYPTDTVYSFGCSLHQKKAIEKLAKLKDVKLKDANFSLICADLSAISEYTQSMDRATYKVLKRNLPGAFTFILPASNRIPKLFDTNKKTVGIRVPNSTITSEIVNTLGHPLVTTSIHDEDEILEYTTDPYLIQERWEDHVDAIVDGGYGNNEASTVVDLTADEVVILRQGIGELRY